MEEHFDSKQALPKIRGVPGGTEVRSAFVLISHPTSLTNGLEITPQITLLLTFFGKKSSPPFIFVTKGTEAPPRHAEIARDR